MSYILDALRKSDLQRRRGVPPTLLAPQAPIVQPGRRPSAVYALLAAAALLGLGIGWLRPWQSEDPVRERAVTKPAETLVQASTGSKAHPPNERKAKPEAPVRKTASLPPAATASVASAKEDDARVLAKAGVSTTAPSAPGETTTVRRDDAAKPAPAKADSAPSAEVAQGQRALSIAELPQSIQQELPKMSISVHAYSGIPRERLVGINGRMLHEGEYIAPGLLLEQVTLDGMILSYKGYRFRHGVR
jgi:general secretion pathway protein B